MEGPSLVILREELARFTGQKVLGVAGNSRLPIERLKGRKLTEIDTWGKVLFLTFSSPRGSAPPLVTKTHFLMFGSYRIDDPKENRSPRLELRFKNGTVYFYSCSLRFDGEIYRDQVDRSVDVLGNGWNEDRVVKKLVTKRAKSKGPIYLCDVLLDQEIFAGSGNIVKNEVLFNLRRHPLTPLSHIAVRDLRPLVRSVRKYCESFYAWKKRFELRRHWQVYRKWNCPVCGSRLIREKFGKLDRKNFHCPRCQRLRRSATKLVVHPVLPLPQLVKAPDSGTLERRGDIHG